MGLLDGKRLLVTGVITDASIAFHVARVAQEQGAQVVLTGFGRMSLVERIAQRLPQPAPVVELDVSDQGQLDSLADRVTEHLGERAAAGRGAALDRLRPRLLPGRGAFLDAPWEDVATAMQVSAYSFKALATALLPLLGRGRRRSSGMDFDNRQAWPAYDWMGVAKADAGVGHPVPGPGPRAAGHPGQPGRGRPAEDDGRQVDPRLRRVRGRVGRAGPAGLGPHRPGAGREDRAARCSRTGCRPPPGRWSGPTAASTRSASERENGVVRVTVDALLVLSFGGPEGPDDVRPFLENVTRGRGVPPGAARRGRGALPALRRRRPRSTPQPGADRGRPGARIDAAGLLRQPQLAPDGRGHRGRDGPGRGRHRAGLRHQRLRRLLGLPPVPRGHRAGRARRSASGRRG